MSRIILITGGSRGLGRNMAEHLAQSGHDIIATYHRNKNEADALVGSLQQKGRRAAALQLDVTRSESFKDFTQQVKQVLQQQWQRDDFDGLINNAGFGSLAPIAQTSEEQFDQLMHAHLKGPFFLTQNLLPLLANNARIINISSGLARYSIPGNAAYAMMKGGIEVFTRYLAKELGSRGIRVNTIAPGGVATDFNGGRLRDDAQYQAQISSITALGRPGEADDIGSAVAALMSDGGWINGQRIEVSGGALL